MTEIENHRLKHLWGNTVT